MIINKSICDNCGKEDDTWHCPVRLSCGFGSIFDDELLDFCSDKCCMEFIQTKLKEVEEKGSYTLPVKEKYLKKVEDENGR